MYCAISTGVVPQYIFHLSKLIYILFIFFATIVHDGRLCEG